MSNLKNFAMSTLVAGSMMGEAVRPAHAVKNFLEQGEISGFRGVFCNDVISARTFMKSVQENKPELIAGCLEGEAPIKIVKQIENGGEWKILEVEDLGENRRYIVTTLPFRGYVTDAHLEEAQFETKKDS